MMISQSDHVMACSAKRPFIPGFRDERPMAGESLLVDTHIVLLPIEPYRVFVYWDIAAADLKRVHDRWGKWTSLQPLLRIRDVSHPYQNAPRQVLQRKVDLRTGKCYVPLSMPDRYYDAELGFVADQGDFILLGRSNEIHSPRAWPAKSPDTFQQPKKHRAFPLVPATNGTLTGFNDTGRDFQIKADLNRTSRNDITSMNEAVFRTGFYSEQVFSKADHSRSDDE